MTSVISAKPPGAKAWRTVGACAYGLVFGWGISAISLGASLASLMIVVISPLQGLAVDRFGSRRTVL